VSFSTLNLCSFPKVTYQENEESDENETGKKTNNKFKTIETSKFRENSFPTKITHIKNNSIH